MYDNSTKLLITEEDAGSRLDIVLTKLLPELTRSNLKKIRFDNHSNLLNSNHIPYSIVHQYDKRWNDFVDVVKNIKNNLGINDN